MRVESSDFLFVPSLSVEDERDSEKSTFEKVIKDFLNEVNSQQLEARDVEKKLSEGKIKNFEEALFTVEKAELSLRLLVEMRNKALESYQEIMRMQV